MGREGACAKTWRSRIAAWGFGLSLENGTAAAARLLCSSLFTGQELAEQHDRLAGLKISAGLFSSPGLSA